MRLVGLALFALGFCAASQSAPIVNGSFESGDYFGWTLSQPSALHATNNGQAVLTGGFVYGCNDPYTCNSFVTIFDQFEKRLESGTCNCNTPERGLLPSDGDKYAFWNMSSGLMSMSQTISLGSSAQTLLWDQAVRELSYGVSNFFSVEIADINGNLLATAFSTAQTGPNVMGPNSLPLPNLAAVSADISAFAGQTVQLKITMASTDQSTAMFDNFRIAEVPEPSTPLLAAAAIAGLALSRRLSSQRL